MQRIERYEVQEEIARGAFGAVFRARDAQLGREVAIKVLLARHEGRAQRERFQREAEALARLRHPHVVSVHAVGETEGRPFLVLDFVEGEDLEQRLTRDGPLPPAEATALIATLAHALQAIHDAGLLHRDLKPANVLLRADGVPLLSDFGLARDEVDDRTRLSQTGQMLGTPGYWAPEQARGDLAAIGPRTDVYGLGAVFYACLTGEAPIEGDSLLEVLAATEARTIEPPSRRRRGIDTATDRVCLQALAKAPRERYPSAEAFADDLERLLSGSRVAARRRRLRLGAGALAGALVVLALVGGALGWRLWIRPKRIEDRLARIALLMEKTRLTEAKPIVAELLALDPDNVRGLTYRAELSFAFGANDEARAQVARALSLQPGFAPALLLRARLHSRAQDHPAAIADYEAILSQEPDHLPARYGLSATRRNAGDVAGATAELGAAIERDPAPALGQLTAYADLLLKLRRYTDAELACNRAIAGFTPDSNAQLAKRVHFQRGQAREAMQSLAGAEADYKEAARRVPGDVSVWFRLARLRYQQDKLDGAIRACDRALEISPRFTAALIVRARSYEKLGQHRDALRDYDAILKRPLIPADWISMRYRRSRVRSRLLDMPGAERDLTAILQRRPKHVRALVRRADIRVSLSRLPDAIADLDRARRLLRPGDPTRDELRQRREQLNEVLQARRRARGR